MDFTYPPEAESFRAELRAWLEENLDEELVDAGFPTTATEPTKMQRLRAWNRTLAQAGYAAISWPPEYGGRGAGVMEQVVLAEEMSRAGAPGTLNRHSG